MLFYLTNFYCFLFLTKDIRFLLQAVAAFGVCGACKIEEIIDVKMDNIKDNGTEIVVRHSDDKTKVSKKYSISGDFAESVRKYMKLRPPKVKTNRFFIQYRDEKCTVQVIGKNQIATMARKVAEFLQLPNQEGYTGNSFRRTSTTFFDEIGREKFKNESFSTQNLQGNSDIKRQSVEKSTSVAGGTTSIAFFVCLNNE